MTAKTLHLGDGLDLPAEDALESVFGVIGKRGRGKSGMVKVLMEEFCRAGLPFVALDPVGIMWGIRSGLDGKEGGHPVLVVGGLHGDVPLHKDGGAEIAKEIVKANVSCVVDFSSESKATYRRFVAEFADTLYRINDVSRHVVIEEAPELVPQRLRPDMTTVFDAVERLVSRGRNKGIGVTLVSQRAATIHKDVLTQLDTLVVFGLTSPQDRKALREWVEAKADAEQLKIFEEGLAGLKRQEAWVWSPEAFEIFGRYMVRPFTTFHPDKTHLRRQGLLSVKPVCTDVTAIIAALRHGKIAVPRKIESTSPIYRAKPSANVASIPVPTKRVEKTVVGKAVEEIENMGEQERAEIERLKKELTASRSEFGDLKKRLNAEPALRINYEKSSAREPTAEGEGEEIHLNVEEKVAHLTVRRKVVTVEAKDDGIRGRMGLLFADSFFEGPKGAGEIADEAEARGWGGWKKGGNNVSMYRELKWFTESAFLRKIASENKKGDRYQALPGAMERVRIVEE